MKENVNHPSHYKKEGRKECIEEMVDLFGEEAVCIWCALNHYKYNYRKGEKEGNSEEQDIKKGKWYMDYIKKLDDSVLFKVPLSVWSYIRENEDK